jgi:hypothetical protein
MKRGCAAVIFALFALSAACGGTTTRVAFDGSTYRSGPIAFQLGGVPSSWRRLEVTSASLAWRDEGRGASVLLNARCRKSDEDTPLVALTNHLLMGSTEREFRSQAAEPFDRREALHTRVGAKWDGVPLELDVFVMKKDGCVYDFVYLCPPDQIEAGAVEFESFVHGFHTLEGSGVVG